MYQGVPVACRTRSKKRRVDEGSFIMGGKRKRVVEDDDDDDYVICLEGEGCASGKKGCGFAPSTSSSDALKKSGFEFLGEDEDDRVEVIDIEDGSDPEEGLRHCEVKVESFGDDEFGGRPEKPIVLTHDSDGADESSSSSSDDGYDSISSSMESENGETSDEDFQVDDDESECWSSKESDSSYDDESGGYGKMVKERMRKVESETESSGVRRRKVKRKENRQLEEEQWIGADCASATSSKSEIRKEKKAEEKHEAKRVESVNADAGVFGDHCQGSGCSKPSEAEALDRGHQNKDGFYSNYSEKKVRVVDDDEAGEEDELHKAQRVPSGTKDQGFESLGGKHDSVKDDSNDILWNELDMLLQGGEIGTGDSTVGKKSGKSNNANASAYDCMNLDGHKGKERRHNKGTGVRSVSSLPKCQENIEDLAKGVIKEDKKGRQHKDGFKWFNSNNRENKVRVVDDETGDKHEVLRMPSRAKDRGFKFFTECFWGKHDSVKDDSNELEEKDDDVHQGQTCGEGIPLNWNDKKKENIEQTESEKELDMLWGELDMLLRAQEIGSQVGNTGTNEARENEESPASHCKHDTILNEEIGIYCRWCGWVATEIRFIDPPLVDYERSGRRVSFGGVNTSQFDGALFNDSGDDSESVWSRNKGSVWDLIPDIKQSLFPHQQEGFEFIWTNLAGTTDLAKLKRVDPCSEGGCIISHAPGTGKTRLTMVFLQTYLQLFPKCLPVIVAPANILLTWEDEFRKWSIGIPFHNMNSADLSGKEHAINEVDWSGNQQQNKDAIRMVKLCSWYKEKSILLISYNLYEKLAGVKSEGDGAKEKRNRKMKKEKKRARTRQCIETAMGKVLREYPGLLILDEGHTPRNQRSCIWKVLSESRTQKRILLSGTPFQNNFLELYNILCLMKPSFPDSIPQELKKFCQSKLIQERKVSKDVNWEPISSGNRADEKINQLKLLMNPFVHVHKGSILQKNLPGLRDCVLVLKPDSLQQKILESIDCSQNTLNFEHKLSLVSVHPSLFLNCSLSKKEESVVDKDQLEKLRLNSYEGVKTKFLKEFVKLCDAINEKVLVFSQFIDTLNLIKDQLQSAFNWSVGTEVLYMHGKLDQKQKQLLIHSFNDANSQVKVLLASIKSCSEGISLIGASRVVLVDVVWNPSVERQAICRAYRLGQKRVVYTYHLLAQDTPECAKYCKQAEKDRLSELVFSNRNAENDKSSGVKFEDTVLDLMVHHVNLKDMFAECLVQPKDRDLETLGG
ncbi:SNF2 domain-containing protein CLASSY 3 [Spatholobus suberectus]|nr:SNF2 domain-containing protein CLASSY 3 [Spatholobus suberectus]